MGLPSGLQTGQTAAEGIAKLLERAKKPAIEPLKLKKHGGYRSGAELRFANDLDCMLANGTIRSYQYEPVTLVIADARGKRARYTPDFMVVNHDGTIVFYEVKGFLREAARIRFLAAAERYPWWTFRMVRLSKDRRGWTTIL